MVSWLALGGFLALLLFEGASSAARSGRSGGVDFSRRRLRGCSGIVNFFVFGIRSLFLWLSCAQSLYLYLCSVKHGYPHLHAHCFKPMLLPTPRMNYTDGDKGRMLMAMMNEKAWTLHIEHSFFSAHAMNYFEFYVLCGC